MGDMNDDIPLMCTTLIANLVGLAIAVAELRQAQQHAAQAAAARTAAEHLYAARARIRAMVPAFARAEAQRPARSRDAMSRISREFPQSPLAGLREPVQPGVSNEETAAPAPQRTSGQSARASPRR